MFCDAIVHSMTTTAVVDRLWKVYGDPSARPPTDKSNYGTESLLIALATMNFGRAKVLVQDKLENGGQHAAAAR